MRYCQITDFIDLFFKMATKSGVILRAQKLGYAKYLSKKRIKPFSGCPHLVRYSMILVSLSTGLETINIFLEA